MALYSATGALQQALNKTPTKNIGKKVLDNFDIDWGILSEVNPMDAKPTSVFTEASRFWNDTPPSIIVSQSNPHSRARSSKKPIATAFRDTPNLIPSRQVETVATPPQTTDMVTPTQVFVETLNSTPNVRPLFGQITRVPPTVLDGNTNLSRLKPSLITGSSPYDTTGISTFSVLDRLSSDDAWGQAVPYPSSGLSSTRVPAAPLPEEWDTPAVEQIQSLASPNGKAASLDKNLLFKQTQAGNESAANLVSRLGLDNEYAAFVQATAPKQSTNPAPPKTKTQSSLVAAEEPTIATTEEVANLPWYKDLRYQLGIGVPVAGLGAYGAYQMMQPTQDEVVYEAPAYGQMPRSFQG